MSGDDTRGARGDDGRSGGTAGTRSRRRVRSRKGQRPPKKERSPHGRGTQGGPRSQPQARPNETEPKVLSRPDHSVSRKLISSAALKVLYRLKKTGHRAYLCGGAVRDLMAGGRPKDFDVATDAQPNEIRRLFRNARIIGRRFRLVHIIFQGEIIEVSTFRRTPNPDEQKSGPEERLITSDNTFGTPREDAFRRDFTMNALFYNIEDFSVIDYVGGIDDLSERRVRVIGDPDLRFCEDPVRMLRACEFAGRLGFSIEAATQRGIQENRGELLKAAPPRLTEELLQLLRCGHAGAAMQWMLELGLLEVLLPETLAMITAHQKGAGSFSGILPTLDRMAKDGRKLPDQVLLGAMLLPEVMLRRFEQETASGKWMTVTQFDKVVQKTLHRFLERFAVANYKKAMLVHAMEGFHRLCGQSWTPAQRVRFSSKGYFDDALLLFEILVHATGEGHEALEQWNSARQKRPRRP
ncbi:MAG: polynucleotide adenylyltransferase PcnB, partial [Acidobacteriota bacterium]